MPGAAATKSATEKLQDVQDFMASESASTQEKVDRMVSFLADDLAGGDASSRMAMLSNDDVVADTHTNDPPNDLVADALAHKNAEEEALLKKLTGGGLMANDDEDELVEQIIDSLASTTDATPQGDALLDTETSTTADGQLASEGDPELVDQVIDALANTNDGAEEGALLTSEFNGETSGELKLEARDNAADMVDQVTQHLAGASEPNRAEVLLAARHSGDLDDLSQLLAKDTATTDEKVDQVVAFLASATERELSTGVPAALTLEATTTSSVGQLRAPAALAASMEQDHLPHMMFGGAFLLVAALLLTVMTKRSRGPRPSVSSHDEAYAYFLHE